MTERRKWSVTGPTLVLFTAVLVVVAVMMSTSVLTARPNEVAVASPQVTHLESTLDALGVQDARVQPTGGGALVSFTYNGQIYNFQVVSAGGVMSITEIPRSFSQVGSAAHLAASRASGDAENAVSTDAVSGGPAVPCCQGGGGGPKAYSVYFDESGLPSGATWNVTVKDGSSEFFISDTTLDYEYDVFDNGTYSYQAVSSSGEYGYYAAEGSFTVSGKTVYIDTTFTEVTSDPSGISSACWWAIFDAFVGVVGLIAAAVACATTGVGCLFFFFFLNVLGVALPTEVAEECGI